MVSWIYVRTEARAAVIGFIGGTAATAAALVSFAVAPNSALALRAPWVLAWLGFVLLDPLYQGFPVHTRAQVIHFALILAGGLQWALVSAGGVVVVKYLRKRKNSTSAKEVV